MLKPHRNDDVLKITLTPFTGFLVPEVAEVENFFLLEGVVKAVATNMTKDPEIVFNQVRINVVIFFQAQLATQVLLYTTHHVKKLAERAFNKTFATQAELEISRNNLIDQMNVAEVAALKNAEFQGLIDAGNYLEILKVFNNKGLLANSGVANLCGLIYSNYVPYVMAQIKGNTPTGTIIRDTIKAFIQ